MPTEQVAILRIQLDGALSERDANEASRQRAVELQKQAESQCVRAQKERDEARQASEVWQREYGSACAREDEARARIAVLEARVRQLDVPNHLRDNEGYDDGDG